MKKILTPKISSWKLVVGSMVLILLLLTTYSLLPTPVYAGHDPNTFGFYCDEARNEVWEDVYYTEDQTDLSDADKHKLADPCGADEVCIPYPIPAPNYSQNAICQRIDELAPSGGGTIMHVPPGEIRRDTSIQIGVSMDIGCFQRVQSTSLRASGRLLNCKMEEPEPTVETNCGCETKQVTPEGPCIDPVTERETTCQPITVDCGADDWNQINPFKDGKRCWKTITCQTNPTGRFDLPLVTDDTNCNNHAPITVVGAGETGVNPTETCRDGQHNVLPQLTDTNNLLVPGLEDDQKNVEKYCLATLDKLLCDQAQKECEEEQKDKREIQAYIKKDDFKALNCNDVPGFIKDALNHFLGGTFCIKSTLAGSGELGCFRNKVALIIKSARPPGSFDAATQDCSVGDGSTTQGGQTTEGNAKLSDISRGLGTADGYLNLATPDFNLPLDPTKCNLYTEKVTLDGDDRGVDISARCDKSCIAFYPPSVCLPTDSILCKSCSNSTAVTTPPAGNEACRQACFATLAEEEQGCESSPEGRDRDNCNNNAVQKKDRCLLAC